MDYNREKLARQLVDEFRAARSDVERMAEQDRKNTLENLAPGQTVPKEIGTLLDKGIRDMAFESIYAHRDAMLEAIDAELKNLDAAMAEAPSPEAAAYVAVIAARDDLTMNEYESAMAAYGGNHAAAKAIYAAAVRSGLHVYSTTPLDEYRAALSQAQKMVVGSVGFAEIVGMSDARAEFFAQTLAGVVSGELADGGELSFMGALLKGHRVV